MNMAKYKTYDEFNRMHWQIGFDTNLKTKGIIIHDFVEMFDKGEIQLNDIDILEEMKVFKVEDSGKMGAMRGYHDDLIMACALALAGLKRGKYYKWK